MEPPTITPLAKYIDVDSTAIPSTRGRVSEAHRSSTKIIVHAKSPSKQPSLKVNTCYQSVQELEVTSVRVGGTTG
jgi:hypothetical protein